MSKQIHSQSHGRGFTLIEVLVALTLIAVSLVSLANVSGQFTSNAASLKQKTLAQWIAENKASEFHITGQFPPLGNKDGNVEMAGLEWRWKTIITKPVLDKSQRQRNIKVLVILEDGDFDSPLAVVETAVSQSRS